MLTVATGLGVAVAFAKGKSHGEKAAANELGVTPPDNAVDRGIQTEAMAKHGVKATPADVVAGVAGATMAGDTALGVVSGDISRREALGWIAGAGAASGVAAVAGNLTGDAQVHAANPKPLQAALEQGVKPKSWRGRAAEAAKAAEAAVSAPGSGRYEL